MFYVDATEWKRLNQIAAIVTKALTEQGDELCWRDIDNPEMATLLGIDFDPQLLPREQHLANCAHFHDCLTTGQPYKTPEA